MNEEYEYTLEESPKCPHCGHKNSQFYKCRWMEVSGGEAISECSECEKEYFVHAYVEIMYNTRKIREVLN